MMPKIIPNTKNFQIFIIFFLSCYSKLIKDHYNKKDRIKWFINRPLIKKAMTAINEGNCILLKPDIACPEVQPQAYLVTIPFSIPPKIS